MGDEKKSKAVRKAEALTFFQEADALLKPCKFCGRIVLARACCRAALGEVKDEQEEARRAKDRAVTQARRKHRPLLTIDQLSLVGYLYQTGFRLTLSELVGNYSSKESVAADIQTLLARGVIEQEKDGRFSCSSNIRYIQPKKQIK